MNTLKLKLNYIILVFISIQLLFCKNLYSQKLLGVKGGNYIGFDLGVQNSGMRKEDFVVSNFSPRIHFFVGKKLNDFGAVQVGYEGFYFTTIANSDKRQFNYYNLRIQNRIWAKKINNISLFETSIQIGGGLFQNLYYRRPNICGDFGIICSSEFNDNISIILRASSIIGWDIYQGDEDIINCLTVGFKYNILKK